MSESRKPATLAAAAWKDLSAMTHAYEAAVMRGDDDVAKAIRRNAHDMLDNSLDMHHAVATARTAITER